MRAELNATEYRAGLSARRPVTPTDQRLRETIGGVVGSVFYGTLLQRMRDSNLKGPVGHGGRGEEVFSAQLHGLLAERMGQSNNERLGDAIYERLHRQQVSMDGLRSAQRDAAQRISA